MCKALYIDGKEFLELTEKDIKEIVPTIGLARKVIRLLPAKKVHDVVFIEYKILCVSSCFLAPAKTLSHSEHSGLHTEGGTLGFPPSIEHAIRPPRGRTNV